MTIKLGKLIKPSLIALITLLFLPSCTTLESVVKGIVPNTDIPITTPSSTIIPAAPLSPPVDRMDSFFDDLVWITSFGTTLSDELSDIAVDNSGNVYVVGEFGAEGIPGYVSVLVQTVRKFSPDGDLLWEQLLELHAGGNKDQFVSIDDEGNVYVVGNGGTGEKIPYLVKLNADGQESWKINLFNFERVSDVIGDAEGNLFIAGRWYTEGNRIDATTSGYVQAFDPQGKELWSSNFGIDTNGLTMKIGITPAGNVIAAGSREVPRSSFQWDLIIRSFSSQGAVLWTVFLGTPESDYIHDVAADHIGNAYIAYHDGNPKLLCLDVNGNQLWLKQLQSNTPSIVKTVLSSDHSGSVYALIPSSNTEVLKLENGIPIWRLALFEEWAVYPTSIEISETGEVFLAGVANEFLPGNSNDFLGDRGVFLLKMTP